MFAGRFTTAIAILALTFIAAHVHGAIITWEFAGEVTVVNDSQGTLGGRVQVGDPFSGTYTFDSTMPDTWPDDPGYGSYDSGASGMHLDIGELQITAPGSDCSLWVSNGSDKDGVGIFAGGFASDGIQILELPLRFRDAPTSLFSDDSLPLTCPDVNVFGQRTLFIDGYVLGNPNARFLITGVTRSLIPEPDSLLLLFLLGISLVKHKPSRVSKVRTERLL